MSELVVLVDEQDNETGVMPKLEAHVQGLLHRAFSVFIFNSRGEMLLQQRAAGKYHSAGLWSNACCSHPRPGEDVHAAAMRRMNEEMGMHCDIKEIFSFVYKAKLNNELTEYEYDHVFTGTCDDVPKPDPTEVSGWKYLSKADLQEKIDIIPEKYTEWFKLCINEHNDEIYKQTPTPETA